MRRSLRKGKLTTGRVNLSNRSAASISAALIGLRGRESVEELHVCSEAFSRFDISCADPAARAAGATDCCNLSAHILLRLREHMRGHWDMVKGTLNVLREATRAPPWHESLTPRSFLMRHRAHRFYVLLLLRMLPPFVLPVPPWTTEKRLE